MNLSSDQQELLAGNHGEAAAMAMRVLLDMAHVEGVSEFVSVTSVHVDGCLMHGATGCYYAEKLKEGGGRVRVPTSLNVGAMDLVRPENVLLKGEMRDLAIRQMNAYVAMGCTPSWTCAPYQAGFRPALGEQVAWAESNAVVFANSVLGARTNRYSDFLDICCALTGYAPKSGMHIKENRFATILIDTSSIPESLKQRDDFYPVLGGCLGREVGSEIAVIKGLPTDVSEDKLKSLGAAAASTGAVALFHVAGVTPEARTVKEATGGRRVNKLIELKPEMLMAEHRRMNSAVGDQLDVVALGSPHFSLTEFESLFALMAGRKFKVPVYVCTGRHVLGELEQRNWLQVFEKGNVRLILDTCVVVTPVIEAKGGVLMTNSGKFAHYSSSLIGHDVVFGSLSECVESAVAGRVIRDPSAWGLA
ncbi:MAG: putative aconitase [Rhodothermales bacterium]|jgi:predicted aconitase